MGILMCLLLATLTTMAQGQGTEVGFYLTSCPLAGAAVQSAVRYAILVDPTIAPSLLKLFFSDCFVNGCDGSVLIDGPSSEKTALANARLRGFEVIDDAKSRVEGICPGLVSCADIVAFAANEAVLMMGGSGWAVSSGRLDGLVSRASDAAVNLPASLDSISVQISKFNAKGLSIQDFVTLVGAHTVGKAACEEFSYRLYNFQNTNQPDPDINPTFLTQLQALCPDGGDGTRRVDLDTGSANRFDNSFYTNLRNGRGVLESDAKLWSDATTQPTVQQFLGIGGLLGLTFDVEFGKSMVKMGNIDVKAKGQGEVRLVCRTINNS